MSTICLTLSGAFVSAVGEGHAIFANIQKLPRFLLSSNIGAA